MCSDCQVCSRLRCLPQHHHSSTCFVVSTRLVSSLPSVSRFVSIFVSALFDHAQLSFSSRIIQDGRLVDLPLSRAMLKWMSGSELQISDVIDVLPDLATTITQLQVCLQVC
jgi:hypothetical protein